MANFVCSLYEARYSTIRV